MSDSAKTSHERRKTPRTTLNKILYINLEPGNGGIVLNLSDGGLAFHSVAPVQQQGPVRLWFSLSSNHRLEASGDLVWTDQKKKTGGVRFTNLPDSTREHIRNLLGELSIVGRAPSTQPASLPASSQVGVTNHEPARTLPQENPPPNRLQVLPSDRLAIVGDSKNEGSNDSWAALPPCDEGPSLGRVLFLLIVAILIVAVGLLLRSHGHEVGATLVQWGGQLKGKFITTPQLPPQVAPQAPAQISQVAAEPPVAQAPVPVSDPPATSAAPIEGTQNPAADISLADVSPAKGPRTIRKVVEEHRTSARLSSRTAPSEDEDDGEADLAIAQRYLDGTGRIRNSAAAAQFLWAAVAKGSSGAELALGQLYIHGDGVSKSCEQARVLLQAASGHGNAEAEEELTDLRKRCH